MAKMTDQIKSYQDKKRGNKRDTRPAEDVMGRRGTDQESFHASNMRRRKVGADLTSLETNEIKRELKKKIKKDDYRLQRQAKYLAEDIAVEAAIRRVEHGAQNELVKRAKKRRKKLTKKRIKRIYQGKEK